MFCQFNKKIFLFDKIKHKSMLFQSKYNDYRILSIKNQFSHEYRPCRSPNKPPQRHSTHTGYAPLHHRHTAVRRHARLRTSPRREEAVKRPFPQDGKRENGGMGKKEQAARIAPLSWGTPCRVGVMRGLRRIKTDADTERAAAVEDGACQGRRCSAGVLWENFAFFSFSYYQTKHVRTCGELLPNGAGRT